jgi:signal transduction histidine kinase
MRKIKRKIEKLEQERALERERTRISRDMHDEVGSSLSEIAILSELAKKKPSEAETHINEISERATEVIDSVSEIVWAMNPQNDKLDNLIGHIRRYSIKYLNLSNIECQFSAPEKIPSQHLSTELRRNIFLVVKEALHNIAKHAGALKVLFTIELASGQLVIEIKDDGKGFIITESSGIGNGLINMRKRIEDTGGIIKIESIPGKGTQIHFSVKLIT